MKDASRKEVIDGYRKLAFGDVRDGVKLLFIDELHPNALRRMDLFCVAEVKGSKTGREVRFYDRMAALKELRDMLTAEEEKQGDKLYEALSEGAAALRGGEAPCG